MARKTVLLVFFIVFVSQVPAVMEASGLADTMGVHPNPGVEEQVDDLLGSGDWFSDRGYRHKFLDVDDIF